MLWLILDTSGVDTTLQLQTATTLLVSNMAQATMMIVVLYYKKH